MALVEPKYFVLVEFSEVVQADVLDDPAVRLLKKVFVYPDLDLVLNRLDVLYIDQALHRPILTFHGLLTASLRRIFPN